MKQSEWSQQHPFSLKSAVAAIWHMNEWFIIGGCTLLRFLFCILFSFIFASSQYVPLEGKTYSTAGSDGYIQIAHTLYSSWEYAFSSGGEAVHNRPPVQPLLMLLFGGWSIENWYYFWFVGSAILSFAYLAVVMKLSREMHFSDKNSRILLLIVGLHPYLIFISKSTTFVIAGTLLVVLTVYLFFRISSRPFLFAAMTGISCGLGCLTHGSFLLFPIVLGFLMLLSPNFHFGRRFLCALVLVVTSYLIVSPWTARNFREFQSFIPVCTGKGYQYWVTDKVYFGGKIKGYVLYKEVTGKQLIETTYSSALYPKDDEILWLLGKKDMLERPLHTLKRIGIGLFAFWAPWDTGWSKAVVSGILNFPVVILILILLLKRFFQKAVSYHQFVIFCAIAYFVGVFAFFTAYGSYFIMILPLLFILLMSLFESHGVRYGRTPTSSIAKINE